MTNRDKTNLHDRMIMAQYYAYGRKDAGLTHIDPVVFADYYAAMYADMQSGAVSFCPSVQDAFGYWLTTVTP